MSYFHCIFTFRVGVNILLVFLHSGCKLITKQSSNMLLTVFTHEDTRYVVRKFKILLFLDHLRAVALKVHIFSRSFNTWRIVDNEINLTYLSYPYTHSMFLCMFNLYIGMTIVCGCSFSSLLIKVNNFHNYFSNTEWTDDLISSHFGGNPSTFWYHEKNVLHQLQCQKSY